MIFLAKKLPDINIWELPQSWEICGKEPHQRLATLSESVNTKKLIVHLLNIFILFLLVFK